MSSDNFQKISLGSEVTYLKPEEVGDNPVIGTYLESFQQETKFGIKTNYKIDTDNGLVVVNGAGNLGFLMKQIEPGSRIKIEYNGKTPMKKGNYKGTPAHDFSVSVARN